ncbi:hypothetical protein LPB90_13170 [Chryseobacterium sp. LC2016-29]|uniref:hypothetical protein n=1 Tax=Chryseobacterium sp. LC2016-29 TaxID=2897331 RepID=UPI001E50C94F|nr:hypothetical protein [Chryseobacterium sp. LC2016-29]MCD0479406.1 hypothetical protein [Chryseobacterium sp. LC2016-29]
MKTMSVQKARLLSVESCISCHSNTKAGHDPFHELYMVMRDAKKFGKNSPENLNTRGGLKPKIPTHMREKNKIIYLKIFNEIPI